MGQRAQAAAGCLTVVLGAGVGLVVWAARAQDRIRRFEQGPDWSVLYAELPLLVLAGTAGGLGVWAVLRGFGSRRRSRLKARRAAPPAPPAPRSPSSQSTYCLSSSVSSSMPMGSGSESFAPKGFLSVLRYPTPGAGSPYRVTEQSSRSISR
ncbi:hypothetical protein QFZ49_003479 [Streptomyces turgidiscabies]|uniref:Integral membrane protein n=1 Tax=Streptomyces turgidiscabies TaxID=85558 RepID=A0ABU0RNJ7_9ACTN|nr:hypothetical protein [Streptomyces turgidiscabies]